MREKNSMTALWERWYLRGYGIKDENGNIVPHLVNSHKPFTSDLGSCRKLLGKLEKSRDAGVLVLNLSNGRRPPKRLEIEVHLSGNEGAEELAEKVELAICLKQTDQSLEGDADALFPDLKWLPEAYRQWAKEEWVSVTLGRRTLKWLFAKTAFLLNEEDERVEDQPLDELWIDFGWACMELPDDPDDLENWPIVDKRIAAIERAIERKAIELAVERSEVNAHH